MTVPPIPIFVLLWVSILSTFVFLLTSSFLKQFTNGYLHWSMTYYQLFCFGERQCLHVIDQEWQETRVKRFFSRDTGIWPLDTSLIFPYAPDLKVILLVKVWLSLWIRIISWPRYAYLSTISMFLLPTCICALVSSLVENLVLEKFLFGTSFMVKSAAKRSCLNFSLFVPYEYRFF